MAGWGQPAEEDRPVAAVAVVVQDRERRVVLAVAGHLSENDRGVPVSSDAVPFFLSIMLCQPLMYGSSSPSCWRTTPKSALCVDPSSSSGLPSVNFLNLRASTMTDQAQCMCTHSQQPGVDRAIYREGDARRNRPSRRTWMTPAKPAALWRGSSSAARPSRSSLLWRTSSDCTCWPSDTL